MVLFLFLEDVKYIYYGGNNLKCIQPDFFIGQFHKDDVYHKDNKNNENININNKVKRKILNINTTTKINTNTLISNTFDDEEN
jgi:hypothetical protein